MALVLSFNTITTMPQNNTTNLYEYDDVKPKIFHDFLGPQVTNCAATISITNDVSPSPSAFASPAGGPISTASDLGSDRQVGSHLEGVPFYGQRNDFSSGNRYAGSKRSNSVFMGSPRDGVPQMRPDFPETSHLMKILRKAEPKRLHEDEAFGHPMRPTCTSSQFIQPATGAKADANASKWDRAIPVNVGPVLQYPPRATQAVPYALSNRFKEANVGASQSAGDEGSRTGIKGSSGILTSVNVSGGVGDQPSTSKQKSAISVPDPGSSTPLCRPGSASAGRQMTIFYGGQAHVFDDVHPNKADAIMALAGSSGGSWSTSHSPSSATKPPSGESNLATGENTGMAMASNSGLPVKDICGRLYVSGNSNPGSGSSAQLSLLPGGQGKSVIKDARQPTQAAAEASTEEKL